MLVFGCFALLGGFLTLLLPETRDLEFPDTFEEAEVLGKSKLQESEKLPNYERHISNIGDNDKRGSKNGGFLGDGELNVRL